MTIVINFGDILYWVAIIFGGFFGLHVVGWIVGAIIRDLQKPWVKLEPGPGWAGLRDLVLNAVVIIAVLFPIGVLLTYLQKVL